MLTKLEQLTLAVEAAGVDIAPEYKDYLELALAIATSCGEEGRACFHRICTFHHDYQHARADKFFTNLLRCNKGRVNLGTAFHLAKQAGVTVAHENERVTKVTSSLLPLTHARTCEKEAKDREDNGEEELQAGSEPNAPLPFFPEYAWPEPLATILSYGRTPAQRDILLLGAFTVLGTSLGQRVCCNYGGRLQHPCMQTFVVSPPASGKGILSMLRYLVAPIHDELRQTYNQRLKAYQKEKLTYDNAGRERVNLPQPEKPVNKMFLISGNNSGTGILQNIMDADGVGLIFESEADTISTAIGSDYGHWSDTLRKAFDHDRLSYNRRMDQEYREVPKSYLGVLLSGTPAQVRPLIPSAENGLFSRQLFYYMPGIREWQSQFVPDEEDFEAVFRKTGRDWCAEVKGWNCRYTLRLSAEQKTAFDSLFATLFLRSGFANGHEMNSSVARLAINVLRIMMVVGMLRRRWTPATDTHPENLKDGIIASYDFTLSDDDFMAVMSLVEPLYRHATHILSFLPGTDVSRRSNSDADSLFLSLPDTFTLQMYYTLAQDMGIRKNCAKTYLNRGLKKCVIRHGDEKATYVRVRV